MRPLRVAIGASLFILGLILAWRLSPMSPDSLSFWLVLACPIVGLIVLVWGASMRGNGLQTYYTIRDSDNLAQLKYLEQMEYLTRNEVNPWKKD